MLFLSSKIRSSFTSNGCYILRGERNMRGHFRHIVFMTALIAKGADPNTKGEWGWTALTSAAREGREEPISMRGIDLVGPR
jgi:hypothetical protein